MHQVLLVYKSEICLNINLSEDHQNVNPRTIQSNNRSDECFRALWNNCC